MRFEETDSLGSFAALGIGFLYEYNARLKALQVSRAGSCLPLVFLEFEGPLLKDPSQIVLLLDKTTQVQALKFSNNITVNLAETLDDSKLPAMLERAFDITIYANELRSGRFTDFQEQFIEDHGFRRFEIRTTESGSGLPFYLGTAETQRRNTVSVRSSTVHGLALYLSDKIVEDIIAKEFAYSEDSGVQKLLNAASVLSTLSLVLNERFDPARKISSKASSLLSRLASNTKTSANSTL